MIANHNLFSLITARVSSRGLYYVMDILPTKQPSVVNSERFYSKLNTNTWYKLSRLQLVIMTLFVGYYIMVVILISYNVNIGGNYSIKPPTNNCKRPINLVRSNVAIPSCHYFIVDRSSIFPISPINYNIRLSTVSVKFPIFHTFIDPPLSWTGNLVLYGEVVVRMFQIFYLYSMYCV